AQKVVELLDLPALALPSHPEAFAFVPPALPVKEEEPSAGFSRVARIEVVNRRAGGGDDLGVVRLVLGRRVAQVAENGEMNIGIEIARRLHLEVLGERPHTVHAAEDRRDDGHRACVGRKAGELQPWQPPRRDEAAERALYELDGELAGRNGG